MATRWNRGARRHTWSSFLASAPRANPSQPNPGYYGRLMRMRPENASSMGALEAILDKKSYVRDFESFWIPMLGDLMGGARLQFRGFYMAHEQSNGPTIGQKTAARAALRDDDHLRRSRWEPEASTHLVRRSQRQGAQAIDEVLQRSHPRLRQERSRSNRALHPRTGLPQGVLAKRSHVLHPHRHVCEAGRLARPRKSPGRQRVLELSSRRHDLQHSPLRLLEDGNAGGFRQDTRGNGGGSGGGT
ncbi:uncharacterized protein LOC9647787 [Selaginella moellendorffii]|uniref:uncharacterized protein LOC9647787 n=1 Tax=Selaginella moellendorffii TaxID=88036 RepID=UPI000D1D076B|nr:uncharacterized protein LOC9647787 [Selaginella moellendorffii]|eukprot:XP_002981590.2 uncharacterized protein LOC9647787 [Selaginella moellendorffii]